MSTTIIVMLSLSVGAFLGFLIAALLIEHGAGELMSSLTINVGEPLFSFRSKNDWITKSPDIWLRHGANVHTAICVDEKGRVVQCGEHFERAEKDGSYPITVYRIQADEPKAVGDPAHAPASGASA